MSIYFISCERDSKKDIYRTQFWPLMMFVIENAHRFTHIRYEHPSFMCCNPEEKYVDNSK